MSEINQNKSIRIEALTDFSTRLINGENGKMLIEKHQSVLDTVTATEAMIVFDQLLSDGIPHLMVKENVGKIINVFYKSLSKQTWEKPEGPHFLTYLMQENREVEKIMTGIKAVIKLIYKSSDPFVNVQFDLLRSWVLKLKEYELHYTKKENILFPYIEKVFPQYKCLQLMWSFHDDFRQSIKNIDQILLEIHPDKELLNKELGILFFTVLPVIFREEQIVFPVAYRAIPMDGWDEMLKQCSEIGWCYIEAPVAIPQKDYCFSCSENKINLGTGFLTPEQIIMLFNHLPVDITFVDEHDEVCYFSGTKDRIFPRSKAIIGRKVQNCHPHDSVHIVNEIVNAFKNGEKDHTDFWIQMNGKFILIRYFALRDESGSYKGTIEVSQEVNDIRALEGERRLLEWKR